MKRTAVVVVLTLMVLLSMATTAMATEYYFKFKIDSREELQKLTRVISIDNVRDGEVWAYANDREMAEFERLGYDWTELPHPGTLYKVESSSNLKDLRAWDVYPTFSGYQAMMAQFEIDHPSLCEIVDIGNSVNGRPILFARISDNVSVEENEPEVMYTSSMHGDETTGAVLMLRMIDSLLSAYGTDSEITAMVDHMEIWINPFANPDGSYGSGDPNVLSNPTRYNSNSVDLNRNYPDPEDGPHPDGNSWQTETVHFMNFASAHTLVISANHHGGAEVINYPWDTWSTRHADDAWWIDISRMYADSAQHYSPSGYMTYQNNGITNGYDWYSIAGGRQDYMNYWHHCREVTLELSGVKFLPASQLPSLWVYNRQSLFDWLRQANFGIKGVITDASTSLPLFAMVTVLGHDIDSSQIYTDPDVGDYHRMIEAGTWNLVFASPGYYPDTVFGITTVDRTVQTVDVQLQPLSNEPVLVFVGHNAGSVDPGDAVSMKVTLENNGAGDGIGVAGTLSCSDGYITITQNTTTYPTITALGGTGTSITAYQFDIDPTTPMDYSVQFVEHLTANGGYSDSIMFSLTIGKVIEDFESGDFTMYPWQMTGNEDWQLVGSDVYEGVYSSRSGSITHNQTSSMSVTLDNLDAGNISFQYKVSSESNYDYLRFYVDDQQKGQWAGEVDWTEATFAVTSGSHAFRWTYYKDGLISSGSDCGWVDYIVFPDLDSDIDDDGVVNNDDNCPMTHNPTQEDADSDDVGDVCDNCPDVPNPDQADANGNNVGDVCEYICGDIDGDGGGPVISDLTYLVAYLFTGGPVPPVMEAASIDGEPGVVVGDLTYLVAYLFTGGPDPICE
ncbi:MAG: thrombospondin type 3 repeat-containing protein [candidate division Zixibacteria bacterium]|nr:thrombospondin type 3 repeat-containing protein [candidate division Zixibacteria bacterium]